MLQNGIRDVLKGVQGLDDLRNHKCKCGTLNKKRLQGEEVFQDVCVVLSKEKFATTVV